ncbi:MAG: hypothetical protein KA484_07295 [Rhodocyclaceae bacterium]|nr:hypothetical protein [Rhodocyclaceae bacterium]
MTEKPSINQIAICTDNLEKTSAFYAELFELPRVGGTLFKGKVTESVTGLPGAQMSAGWLMDDRDFFQFEMFQYHTPVPKAFGEQRQPWDIGYSRIALEVNNLEAFHQRCTQRAVKGLSAIKSVAGKSYFVLSGPNNVLIEIGQAITAIPKGYGARFAGVALNVPDLAVAMNSYHKAIGCPVISNTPADKGSLWDEAPSPKHSVLLDGGTVWLELNEYTNGKSAAWPDGYRICDFGQQNVAFGSREGAGIKALYERMVAGGFRPNTPLVSSMGQVQLTYLNDPKGFNVEILMVRPWLDGVMGFRHANWFDRVLTKIMMALA